MFTDEHKRGTRNFSFRSRRQGFLYSKFPKNLKIKNQKGQALVEYVLLLSVAVGFAIAINATFSGLIGKGVTTFNGVLEHELSTGNFPENDATGNGTIWTGGQE